MTGDRALDPNEAGAAFARRLHAFHAGLPREERQLLERLLALAAEAQSSDADAVQGYVVTEKLGADHIVHKHLAGVKYEDVTLSPPVQPPFGGAGALRPPS
ncbi:MAG TPA: hypothetical protein VKV26_02290 [Dehalococcoidia bacterium]|nr:hypothetical protein [Dehalococcoidia bacterium]